MNRVVRSFAVAALMALAVAGCGSTGSSSLPSVPSTLPSGIASALPSPLPSVSVPGSSEIASAAGALQIAVNAQAAKGPFLVGPDGKTLYVFSRDTASASNCSGSCAQTWPPLTLPAGSSLPTVAGATGKFGTITRSDGSTQVTYKGAPLYSYSGDSKPGDTNGDGVGGAWSIAKA